MQGNEGDKFALHLFQKEKRFLINWVCLIKSIDTVIKMISPDNYFLSKFFLKL